MTTTDVSLRDRRAELEARAAKIVDEIRAFAAIPSHVQSGDGARTDANNDSSLHVRRRGGDPWNGEVRYSAPNAASALVSFAWVTCRGRRGRDWFNPIAAHLGKTYWAPDTGRVMAFTKGSEQEVEYLVGALGLEPGQRVLDVGCGPGRHSLELARRGLDVVGVDLSPDFIARFARAAAEADRLTARFEQVDVRELAYDGEFDAVICLCQGGFGLLGGHDEAEVFGRIVRAIREAGALAVTAFQAAFAVRHLEDGETFDPATGVLHEIATVRNEAGEERPFDLWTTCFTPRELTLLAEGHRIEVQTVSGVTPGAYRASPPTLDDPELLLIGRRRP